ncbi:YtxH domain-containing protein [Mangrovibacillus cuniculi]|uniref:YtxH domain-containing protein n=1 Tax=Mangrovibacillus cuniculi TaxID=2593652 RepID=A0A7S8HEV1_9BACI|nr:YtxH domain-containing protein [Mangrovibacillus cuniculi]QPC45755.1 YtxH domain-containing protein [Mangrovibacillus cuniculi]
MRMITGVLIGAVVGGTLSLLDKQTRESFETCMKKTGNTVKHTVQHPKETYHQVSLKTEEWKVTATALKQDVDYVINRVNELKKLTPQVTGLVQDTVTAVKDTVNHAKKSER